MANAAAQCLTTGFADAYAECPTTSILDEFRQAIESLETWVLSYEQRLEVVARPEYCEPHNISSEPAPSVSAAREQLNRIHHLTNRLVTLNDRLEL